MGTLPNEWVHFTSQPTKSQSICGYNIPFLAD